MQPGAPQRLRLGRSRPAVHGREPSDYTPGVIYPLSLDDVDQSTDEQIVAAYVADGVDEAGARGYLAIIRGDIPPDVFVD